MAFDVASNPQPTALIDWLSVSVVPPDGASLNWVGDALSMLFGIPRDCWHVTGSGWFGYRQRINLGEWGLLAYGGERQRGTVHFELNAHACARITNWQSVRAWGESMGARITRVDLAHDDFEGKAINIPQMLAWNDAGSFSNGGRPAKARLVDDLGSGEGKTFYVGKRKHGKLLRGYEKGKQLGKPDDPWFRVEVELHNKGRVIPWAILREPGPYLAGAYPCLAFLHGEQCRIATQRRALELTYDRMERWLSEAGGKALNAMMTAHHGDALGVIDRLVKEGFPKRLTGFSADDLNQLGDMP